MSRSQVLDTLASLTQHQHGLVTAAQAAGRGVSMAEIEELTADEQFVLVADGVYRSSFETAPPFVEVWAAWLQLKPDRVATERLRDGEVDAAASHLTAADILGLGVLESGWISFTVRESQPVPSDEVRLFAEAFDNSDWSLVDGLPVMNPLRVIEDLAKDTLDAPYLGAVVLDVIERRLADRDAVASALDPHAATYGVASGAVLSERLLHTAKSGFRS